MFVRILWLKTGALRANYCVGPFRLAVRINLLDAQYFCIQRLAR